MKRQPLAIALCLFFFVTIIFLWINKSCPIVSEPPPSEPNALVIELDGCEPNEAGILRIRDAKTSIKVFEISWIAHNSSTQINLPNLELKRYDLLAFTKSTPRNLKYAEETVDLSDYSCRPINMNLLAHPKCSEVAPVSGTILLNNINTKGAVLNLTLEFPPFAGFFDSKLILLEEMTSNLQNSQLLEWNAGELFPGTYVLTISALSTYSTAKVLPKKRTAVHLIAPKTRQVTINVFDIINNRFEKVDCLLWGPNAGEAISAAFFQLADVVDTQGGFVINAPIGPLSCMVGDSRYSNAWHYLEINEVDSEYTIFIDSPCVAEISITCDSLPILIQDYHLIRAFDNEGRFIAVGVSRTADARCEVSFPSSGQYMLEVPSIEGFDGIRKKSIEVDPSRVVHVDFQFTAIK